MHISIGCFDEVDFVTFQSRYALLIRRYMQALPLQEQS
jgi:hypothetical protein